MSQKFVLNYILVYRFSIPLKIEDHSSCVFGVKMMNRIRAFSSPAVLPTSSSTSHIEVRPEDHSFEGNLYNACVI